jgi:hypothetical protein
LADVDLRGADVTGADFSFTRVKLIRVHGLIGFPADAEGIVIGKVDLSPAGDGSEIIDGEEWLLLRKAAPVV